MRIYLVKLFQMNKIDQLKIFIFKNQLIINITLLVEFQRRTPQVRLFYLSQQYGAKTFRVMKFLRLT